MDAGELIGTSPAATGGYRWLPVTNSNILHRGIVSRTGSNDREAYHVGYVWPTEVSERRLT